MQPDACQSITVRSLDPGRGHRRKCHPEYQDAQTTGCRVQGHQCQEWEDGVQRCEGVGQGPGCGACWTMGRGQKDCWGDISDLSWLDLWMGENCLGEYASLWWTLLAWYTGWTSQKGILGTLSYAVGWPQQGGGGDYVNIIVLQVVWWTWRYGHGAGCVDGGDIVIIIWHCCFLVVWWAATQVVTFAFRQVENIECKRVNDIKCEMICHLQSWEGNILCHLKQSAFSINPCAGMVTWRAWMWSYIH